MNSSTMHTHSQKFCLEVLSLLQDECAIYTYFDSKTFLRSHGQSSLLMCGVFMNDKINLGHDQFKASIFQCLWKK